MSEITPSQVNQPQNNLSQNPTPNAEYPTPNTELRPSESPSLEFLKNQAKSLLKSLRAREDVALSRLAERHPHPPADLKLADAQYVIAREQGFASWPRLKAYVNSVTGTNVNRFRAIESELSFYEGRAEGLLNQHAAGLPLAAQQIRRTHPRFRQMLPEQILAGDFDMDDARLVVALEHGRTSWRSLQRWIRDIERGDTVEPFHNAFLALKSGDSDALLTWLQREPSLVTASGTNGNTLLNLAVSLGNVAAVRILVQKGANVNATNVRGWTPLHQAGYGNRVEIAEWLLAHGADPTPSALGDGGTPLVLALFWGHSAVADLLANQESSR